MVWVFGWNLSQDRQVAEVRAVLERAAKAGYTGAVLSAGLDSLGRKPPEFFPRLEAIRDTCRRLGLELIPAVFSVGYGGGVLGYNPHLAEGLPVRDALFVAGGSEARFVPEPEVRLVNGGFEEHKGDRFAGYRFHDQPGEVSFADETVKRSGRCSIRLEHFTANPYGHGRVMQEVAVRPWRCYRVRLWVRTEGLEPAGAFRIAVLAGNRSLAPRTFDLPATTDGWRQVSLIFNSMDFEQVRVYAGVWGGRKGRFWLDDWQIEEVGPVNVLRRPGAPVTVRSEDGLVTYEEGRDYLPLVDPRFSLWNDDHPAAVLRLAPGGRIRPGQRLRVSWYHPMRIHSSQVTVCMAEPELYEICEREAALLAKHLEPRRVLLNMDEVRMGGTCAACAGKDMAKLLGECITRQVEILRRHRPGLEVMAWSDMLDPHHNAHGDYYLVQGSFEGSWRHVPRDLTMAVWGGRPRPESLEFFAREGFRVLAACYYDADNLSEVRRWLELCDPLPNVRGFMYTTWQKKYDLLEQFGELVRSR
ncbi:MAG: hypothetical protein D6766_04805 [Verrucomicrobia bacterium]|nr:MAG: hypothetical protein D6766_04805 [Verrucomicrobiota bacterium]